jgi:hypothetical protein
MYRQLSLLAGLVAALALLLVPGAVASHEGPGEPNEAMLFELFGTAQDDVDSENGFNELISVDTSEGLAGGLNRVAGNMIKVVTLDNQLELKYYFVGRTCGGAGPREVVVIDVDGRGTDRDLVLDGFVGPPPAFTGCLPNSWQFQDLTDNLPRWDVRALTEGSQPAGTQPNVYLPWDVVEAAVTASFPDHRVILLRLVDDSGGFFPAARGCAYYDIVSLGARTMTDAADTPGHFPDLPNDC